MYEIIVNICRYIFLAFIALFLLSGFIVSLSEKNILKVNFKKQLAFQRILILLFHIMAFSILSFNTETRTFQKDVLPVFLISTSFIFLGNLIPLVIYKKSCPLLWNGIFFLISIGIVMLYRLKPYLAFKQIIWVILGFFICLLIPLILTILPRLDFFKYIYLFLGLSLLLATLIFGKEAGGAKNWIKINGFTFQPSEIVKILFVFYLSSCFSKQNLKIRHLIFPSLVSLIFVICLVFQTDLGSALIFFMTYLVLVYISTSKAWIVILGTFLAGIGSFIAYNLFSHVKIRVAIWQNPWEDASGKGYQIIHSLFAIGTFGLFGSGLNLGMPNYIPVVAEDLIFSAICEEFGVLFAIGLMLILIMIFFRGVKIALKNNNRFLSLVSSGLTSLLCFQSFLIIGGVIKFIPLTGVTLPFVSYGGSSMFSNFIIIGILQWISIRNSKYEDQIEYLECIEEDDEDNEDDEDGEELNNLIEEDY